MITLFRKIRLKLIGERRVTNYLFYAIGEIILVVIGILIALAINNYQQEKIIRNKEYAYLQGLREEFETSRKKLDTLTQVNNRKIETGKILLGKLRNENVQISEIEFSRLLLLTFAQRMIYNPNNSLLLEMISSGALKDLSNPELRIKLTNWKTLVEYLEKQEANLDMQRDKTLDMFRNEDYSLRTVFDLTGFNSLLEIEPHPDLSSNLALVNSTAFENNVLLYLHTSRATQAEFYLPIRTEIDEIMLLIDNELTK